MGGCNNYVEYGICVFVDKVNDIDTLFESNEKRFVRLWNLETHKLIKNIHCQTSRLRGMTLWNQKYYTIKVVL